MVTIVVCGPVSKGCADRCTCGPITAGQSTIGISENDLVDQRTHPSHPHWQHQWGHRQQLEKAGSSLLLRDVQLRRDLWKEFGMKCHQGHSRCCCFTIAFSSNFRFLSKVIYTAEGRSVFIGSMAHIGQSGFFFWSVSPGWVVSPPQDSQMVGMPP